jgi:hypothetical protein
MFVILFNPNQMTDVPRPMKFTERDRHILEAIHAFDGMLGAQQIMKLFFESWRTTRERLSKLYQNGYIARPDRRQRAGLPDMIYWLTEKGAEIVADLEGQELDKFKWRCEPKRTIVHDLAVNDFRIAVIKACKMQTHLILEQWIPESEFRAYPDEVSYSDASGKILKKKIIPDGAFVVNVSVKKYTSRLLLEIDLKTEDNPRFAREKMLPGLAYLRSKVYERRFGYKSGRWLVVTTSMRRLMNMKRQAERDLGRDAVVFHFTIFDQLKSEMLLTEPIWFQGGSDAPVSLFKDE